MDILKDIILVIGRITTIIPLLVIITLIMGKRSIGEVPVFDFLIIITLGSVVGADIADPNINHIPTAIAIIFIGLFQRIITSVSLKKRWFGRLITFEPTIVIKDGTLLNANMRRIRYSLDNILQMLREKNIFDISVVELGIIEANGKLTVQKKQSKQFITREDLILPQKSSGIMYPVIVEGKIYTNILSQLNLDKDWLKEELTKAEITCEEVFFAAVNEDMHLHISIANDIIEATPEILH